MNTLQETIRHMGDIEPPKAAALLDHVINTILWVDEHGGADGDEALAQSLVGAYEAALTVEYECRDDGTEYEPTTLHEDDAYAVMRDAYVRTMCGIVTGYSVDSAIECFMWPEALKYGRQCGYTSELLSAIGVALGYLAGQQTKAWYAFCASEGAA